METINNTCPNVYPRVEANVPYRIAICGEAPGADEVVSKVPFSGQSGRLLDYLLNKAGILRAACFVGNVCQHRPLGNDIKTLPWGGPEISQGLANLTTDLATFNPHLCILLGGTALCAAKGFPESITNWRGSLFLGAPSTPFAGRKCIATYHPASALRVYEQTPLLYFDLQRARRQGEKPELVLPERKFEVDLSVEDILQRLADIQLRAKTTPIRVGTDIEGYVDNLTCLSVSETPLTGFMIPFVDGRGSRWDAHDELRLWMGVKGFLEDPNIEKVWQNGLYDRFVFFHNYGICVVNSKCDTMIGHHELYCELPKKLALQASIYTLQPYYKDDRSSDDWHTFWEYGCTDSAITLEIAGKQRAMMTPAQKTHANFLDQLQDVVLYMEVRGMKYDLQEAKRLAALDRVEMYRLQHVLNNAAGCSVKINNDEDFLNACRPLCFKKMQGVLFHVDQLLPNALKASQPQLEQAIRLYKQGVPFDDSRNAEFSMLVGKGLNVESSAQLQQFLYSTLMLPIQYDNKTKQPTTDALALLTLFKKTENPVLKLILKIKHLSTRLESLSITDDPDGRVRCGYNVVGTVTGRLSCSKSPTRSGYNLQTVTKKLRYLFKADPGMFFFQCDLSGADGWTVAAHCARLGDRTMLDDYLFGLKPAKIVALMYEGVNVARLDRQAIKDLCKAHDWESGWLYLGAKRVQHGSNYLMGKQTMSNQILTDSYKLSGDPVLVPAATCADLQRLYFQRYPGVLAWHRWVQEQLKTKRSLTCASGHTRNFFGRPNDTGTLQEAVAHEPQNNTTYATNKAALALWYDPQNRTPEGGVIIEPLHQVHDALCGQFPQEVAQWACAKLRTYFNFQMNIAGQNITIPFEGAYGTDWGNLINII